MSGIAIVLISAAVSLAVIAAILLPLGGSSTVASTSRTHEETTMTETYKKLGKPDGFTEIDGPTIAREHLTATFALEDPSSARDPHEQIDAIIEWLRRAGHTSTSKSDLKDSVITRSSVHNVAFKLAGQQVLAQISALEKEELVIIYLTIL